MSYVARDRRLRRVGGAAARPSDSELGAKSKMLRSTRKLLAAVSLLAAFAGAALAGPKSNELVFRVISFNIRFDFPSDATNGDNWAKRHTMIATLVKDAKASVVCFQEDKTPQVEDLKKDMPGWDFVGAGRDGHSSEHCSV